MLRQILAVCTAERMSALLVYVVGATVGAFAAQGLSPVQWGAAAVAVIGAILVAVLVRTWPAKAPADAPVAPRD